MWIEVIRPRVELRGYVRYFWVMRGMGTFSALTFPIGCPQMIFHRGVRFYVPEVGEEQCRFTLSGQVNFPAHVEARGEVESVVAVFWPHTAGMFLGIPPSEFYNVEIAGYDVECRELDEVARRIFESESCGEAVEMLEAWMLKRLRSVLDADRFCFGACMGTGKFSGRGKSIGGLSLNLRRVKHALGVMTHKPLISVGGLSDAVGLGRRQFERVFRDYVGMNPKEYERVVRFQMVMRCLQGDRRDFAGIAADCGYADQSHMIREFRMMSGHTPKALPGVAVPYSDLFTDPCRK